VSTVTPKIKIKCLIFLLFSDRYTENILRTNKNGGILNWKYYEIYLNGWEHQRYGKNRDRFGKICIHGKNALGVHDDDGDLAVNFMLKFKYFGPNINPISYRIARSNWFKSIQSLVVVTIVVNPIAKTRVFFFNCLTFKLANAFLALFYSLNLSFSIKI